MEKLNIKTCSLEEHVDYLIKKWTKIDKEQEKMEKKLDKRFRKFLRKL